MHVDAAYAGAAAVCPEPGATFSGWERGDSIGVNPHKWLFTPMDCSAFFSRRPDDLRRAFSLVPEYLRVSEDVVSLSEYASHSGAGSARSSCGRRCAVSAGRGSRR